MSDEIKVGDWVEGTQNYGGCHLGRTYLVTNKRKTEWGAEMFSISPTFGGDDPILHVEIPGSCIRHIALDKEVTVPETTKPTNPKDAIGSDKLPMHLWPATATAYGAIGLLNGALKYGRANWREAGVRASIYYDAATRHMNAWFEGEECDPDDGVPHLAAALACLAIIVDADAAGTLNDDRNYGGGGYRPTVDKLTSHVKRLKAHHAGKAPKHWSHADDE